MRKNLLLGLAALAAVTLSCCQKDQVVNQVEEQDAIEFSTYVGRNAQTKATVANVASLKTSGFGVFAYYDSDGTFGEDSKPNFMYNQKVSGDEWSYDPIKYWPSTGKLSFFAYAPHTLVPTVNITSLPDNETPGVPSLNFAVNNNVSQQVDLLYALPIIDVNNTIVGSNVDSNGNDATDDSDKINFQFQHALSRIAFGISTGEGLTVTVTNISLNGNFVTDGSMSLENGDFSNTNSGSQGYSMSFSSDNSVDGTAVKDLVSTDGYLMIIPKNFNSSDITVNVTYTVKENISNITHSSTTATGTIEKPNFEKGKAYQFNLYINPFAANPIIFGEPTVTDWEYTVLEQTEVPVS